MCKPVNLMKQPIVIEEAGEPTTPFTSRSDLCQTARNVSTKCMTSRGNNSSKSSNTKSLQIYGSRQQPKHIVNQFQKY
ncbi:hypothetical protein KM043_013997 [Ampulex compressa]|nr:hypothetical protein KM043_013997 [Ampulex compressa]